MTLITRPEAYQDIYVAAVWLDGLNAGSGDHFYDAVDQFLASVMVRPGLFARVNRPPRGREVRQGRVPGYLFLVTYEVTATQLVVWSVGHAKAQSQPWRRRMAP